MPFLLPAVASAIFDVIVLFLNHKASRWWLRYTEEESSATASFIYHVGYLGPMAMLRLFLVFLPLPYHSYTGTAIRFTPLYHFFYFSSLLLIVGHMLSIIMLDPDSLQSLLPSSSGDGGWRTRALALSREVMQSSFSNSHINLVGMMRYIWIMLSLSFVSVCLHWMLLWHVRSSAPYLDWKRQKHVLYYYASLQQRQNGGGRGYGVTGSDKPYHSQSSSSTSTDVENGVQLIGDENAEDDPLLLPALRVSGTTPKPKRVHSRLTLNGQHEPEQHFDFLAQMRCAMPDGYDEFMLELQTRVIDLRDKWKRQMEDFYARAGSGGAHPGGPLSLQQRNTAFCVLLELFAFQDVIPRLDQVWEIDNGVVLSFYVPQLLSFLLHGACYKSLTQLEEWILAKCSVNIYFAHRCYWFLRAWCLEGHGIQRPSNSSVTLSRSSSVGSWSPALQQADGNSTGSLTPLMDPLQDVMAEARQSVTSNTGKYPPEERSAVEALLARVVECGEIPARELHFGARVNGITEEDARSENGNTLDSPGASGQRVANKVAMVPSDPSTGVPSQLHLESLQSTTENVGLLPSHRLASATDLFHETPDFLDSLMRLADELFLLPRDQRTKLLRQALTERELEFLPSNTVYMPIGNGRHATWRVVPEESIAISTKERVPCIICLEVVDLCSNKSATASPKLPSLMELIRKDSSDGGGGMPLLMRSGSVAEYDMVNFWRRSARHPRRHKTLLAKMTNLTHEVTDFTRDSLRKFREAQQHGEGIWVPGEVENGGDPWSDIRLTIQRSLSGSPPSPSSSPTPTRRNNTEPISAPSIPLPTLSSASSTTSLSDPTTPTDCARETEVDTNMGQWSSPISYKATIPIRRRQQQNDAAAQLSRRRRERTLSNNGAFDSCEEEDAESSEHEAMESLMSIRTSMDLVRQEQGGDDDHADVENGKGNNSNNCYSSSAYGSTPDFVPAEQQQQQPQQRQLVTARTRSSRPPPVVFKESWAAKQERLREQSAYGTHPSWRLVPILIKSNDDLRQEQMASQLIFRMVSILSKERIPVWLCPYEIVALSSRGGVIEAIPDTISIDSLKRNDPNFTSLPQFFKSHFEEGDDYEDAKANFVESLAAYSIVTYLLQIKDRHNGNILLDNRGHLIHIDFGFFFLSSPGKNSGFESAPFKLTRDFCMVMDGPNSTTFRTFRELCCRTFLCLRKHCLEITMLVEMLMLGNEDLSCFRGRPEDAIRELRERFRLDLNDRACTDYVNALIDESLENWRTRWYDRYQRFCVGVL